MDKVLTRITILAAVVAVGIVAYVVMRPKDSATPAGGAAMRLALVPKSIGHPYWEGVREGMNEAAKRLGVEAVFQGAPEASIEEQLKIIESLISQGYDGIGISPNDPDAVKEIIRRAAAKGVAVVTFDSDSPDSERLVYIGTDNRAAGREGGKAMAQILGAKAGAPDKLLVQVIGGKPGAWNLKERMDGFAEGVKDTNIALTDVQYNQESPDTALQVAESVLNAQPDLRGLFSANCFGGAGAALAIKGAVQRGKIKKGQVHVVTFDTTEDILDFIEEGAIDCTLAQNTRQMGRISVEKLVEFARQYRAKKAFDRPAKGKDIVDTGVMVVWPKDVPNFRTKPAKNG
ncbi:MAG: substrate-binding domain-containing protein [Planctomycetota bacterium]|nr:substrate-binding domain-containing protein [Planctomycetota bacterium]